MFRNAKDSQFIPIKGAFSSGLVDNMQNEDISDANACYLRNARIDGIGTKIRSGYSQLATCPSYPVTHLGYWNNKNSSGVDKNYLVYVQTNTSLGFAGQPGFYDITGASCVSALSPTKAYWIGPITDSFNGTLGLYYKSVKFTAELGGFSPIVVADTDGNIVQQFDPSDIDSVEQFQEFQLNYADQDFTHWKLITNGIIHADFGDGIIRDMVLNFGSVVDMVGVDTIFAQALIDLVAYTYNGVTTGYIKVNGADVGPINLSTASSVEDVSTIINTAAGYTLTYIRYGVNDSGENVPYMVFQKTDLATVDRTTTGQGELLWELLGGDPQAATQFYPERLQTVWLNTTDTTIYSSSSADSYYLYSVGVDSGGNQDGFFVLDNDFKQRLSLKPNGVRPKLGVIFDSFHFIAGDTRNASNMYQSVRSYYEDFESPGSDKYTFDGPITAMKTNNKELYIFTKNSIGLLQAGGFTSQGGIYRYNIQQLETQEGALSQAGVVAVGNRIFFWTPSNKIRVVGRDAEGLYDVADLSHREGNGIDLTMTYSINADQSLMFGVYLPKENIIKWFCRSAAGTTNDMAIIFDLEHNTWLVDTYARTTFKHGVSDGNNTYLAGVVAGSASTTASRIYKDSQGALDDSVAYSMEYWSKRWTFGDPTLEKQFWGGRLFFDAKANSSILMQIYVNGIKVVEQTVYAVDGSNTSGNRPLDPNTWETCVTITKGMLRKKGKNIQIRFLSNNSGAQITLKKLSWQVLGLPMETSNKNISNY